MSGQRVPAEPEASTLSLACPLAALLLVPFEIAGQIAPPHGGAPVTLTYTSPEGGAVTSIVGTAPDGSFADASVTPDAEGDWVIDASWPGDEDHLGASDSCTAFVSTIRRPRVPAPAPGR